MAIALKNILIKTAGAGGLGLGVYDAHCRARRDSIRYGKIQMADSTLNGWMNTTRLTKESDVENAMKKGAFKWMLDSPLAKIWGNIKGYTSGFFNSVAENVIPITLSAGALITKGGSLLSKIFAGGLGIYAIYAIINSFTSSARSRKTP